MTNHGHRSAMAAPRTRRDGQLWTLAGEATPPGPGCPRLAGWQLKATVLSNSLNTWELHHSRPHQSLHLASVLKPRFTPEGAFYEAACQVPRCASTKFSVPAHTSSECAPPPQPARGCAHERVNDAVPSATRVARSYWTRRAVATSCVILLFALDKGDALIAGARDDTKRGVAPSP